MSVYKGYLLVRQTHDAQTNVIYFCLIKGYHCKGSLPKACMRQMHGVRRSHVDIIIDGHCIRTL